MPILKKTPPKMAAKSPSSEEEPVSDVWIPLPRLTNFCFQNSPERD